MRKIESPSRAVCSALMIAVALFGVPDISRAQGVIEAAVVSFLYEYIAGKALDLVFDAATGKPDVRLMKRDIDRLANSYSRHSKELTALSNRLESVTTRDEALEALSSTLATIDPKTAKLAARIRAQEDDLAYHRYLISKQGELQAEVRLQASGVREEVESLLPRVDEHGRKLADTEKDIELFKRQFPRWEPDLHVGISGASGFEKLRKGKTADAERLFRFANALDSKDGGVVIGLALCYRALGRNDEAFRLRQEAQSGKLEFRPWYRTVQERLLAGDRIWISTKQ
jgi:tetratricopeptide (TPR) repeat protein